MNIEQLYKSHVDFDLESKLFKKIILGTMTLLISVLIAVLGIIVTLMSMYTELFLENGTLIFYIIGVGILFLILVICLYASESYNPLKKKSLEIQLYIWLVYFLKKYRKNMKISKSKWSLKYLEYIALRMTIGSCLVKIKESIENSFIFYKEHSKELERYNRIRKAIYHIDVTSSQFDKSHFDNLLLSIENICQIYVCVYSEKLAGNNDSNYDVTIELRKRVDDLEEELDQRLKEILEHDYDREKNIQILSIINSTIFKRAIIVFSTIIILVFLKSIKGKINFGEVGVYISVVGIAIAFFLSTNSESK